MQIKYNLLKHALITALTLFILTGCGKESASYVEVKEVAADPQDGPDVATEHGHPGVPSANDSNPGFSYTVPDGWTETAPSSMKLLSLIAGRPMELPAECAVSAFPGDVGGQLANINRWRRQVGLGPVNPEAMDGFVEPVTISGNDGWRVDFTGPSGSGANGGSARAVVSVIFRDGKSWFFKLSGNSNAVEAELDKYDTFIGSVAF